MKRLILSGEDFNKWFKIAVLFSAPVLIIYVGFVLNNIQDGFEWSDFAPNQVVIGACVAYILNEVLAYLKRLIEAK